MKAFCKVGALLLCLANASVSPAGADEGYICSFALKAADGGWMPEAIEVHYAPGDKGVMVMDNIINEFVGQPLAGKVSVDNAKRVTFYWIVKAKDPINQHINAEYRLTYLKASGTAELLGTMHGYSNQYHNSGKCKIL